MRLLVTRPEPDGERTAAALRARGHEVMLAPLLRIETIADADLGAGPVGRGADDQRQCARAPSRRIRAARELTALPVLAVGRSSAEAARAAGFADVASADGDGARSGAARGGAVCRQRARRCSISPARTAPRDLAGELAAHGLRSRPSWSTAPCKARAFRPTVRTALEAGRIDGVLHFSRRSAEAYLDCAGSAVLDAALAPRALLPVGAGRRAARAAGAAQIRVAAQPGRGVRCSTLVGRPRPVNRRIV